jgi:predicted phosphoadenosine phosphosulfate sulfurtransferase
MKAKIKKYIAQWEKNCYFDGIPDEADRRLEKLNKVPSYRKICIAIMKNDYALESLGYSKVKCASYHHFKRIELIERGVIKKSNQLKLKL